MIDNDQKVLESAKPDYLMPPCSQLKPGCYPFFHSLFLAVLLAALTWLAAPTPPVHAQTPVACDPAALVNAISGATAGDTLDLAAGCTYTLSAVNNTTGGANGLPVISIALTINGNGAIITRGAGAPDFRIFYVGATGNLTLENVTISYGRAVGAAGSAGSTGSLNNPGAAGGGGGNGQGGGIYNAGVLTVRKSTITNNTAVGGAGGTGGSGGAGMDGPDGPDGVDGSCGWLGCDGSSPGFFGQMGFPGGHGGTGGAGGSGVGGGIFNAGTLAVINSTISGNSASGGNGGQGGSGGQGGRGGDGGQGGDGACWGLYTTPGQDGGPGGDGGRGGPGAQGGSGGRGEGGGIYGNSGAAQLRNSTISNNSVSSGAAGAAGAAGGAGSRGWGGAGGAGYWCSAIVNGPAGNAGPDGNPGTAGAAGTAGTAGTAIGGGLGNHTSFNFQTSILGDNSAATSPDCYTDVTLTSGGYNLVEDVTNCTIGGDLTGNITSQDPVLGVLQNNGGPTWTHALGSTSPAANAVQMTCETTDQRGVTRPQGTRCDMGAYELGYLDLAISKSAPASVAAGQNITYTLAITNLGGAPAPGLVVTDTLPTGLTFVSASPSICTPAGGTVVCTFGSSLNAGSNTSLTLTAQVGSSVASGSTLTNQAVVGSSDTDPNTANNSASASSTVTTQADMTISKQAPATATAGGQIVYTLYVTNTGPSVASAVVVNDALPTGVTFVSASPSICTPVGSMVTCNFSGSLNSGSGASVSLTAQVSSGLASGSAITNQATVSASQPDPNSANNSASASSVVSAQADLRLGKQAPANATAGGQIAYTLNVTNTGPSAASGVVITDTLPGGVTFVSASPSICTPAGGTVVCTLSGSLDSGASATVILTGLVGSGLSGTNITNQAIVGAATSDPTPANNSASASSAVIAQSDLSLTKQAPATAYAGGQIVYTLQMINTGPSVASTVVITDTLPTGVSLVSYTASVPVLCTPAGGAVVCSFFGTMAVGGSSTLTLTAQIDSGLVGLPIINQAVAGAAEPDSNPANNSASASSLTIALADVGVSKQGPVNAIGGAPIVYTLQVSNTGPSVAALVDVSDSLPDGVQFSTATASRSGGGAGQCSGPTCRFSNLAVGETATMTVTGVVLASLPDGQILTNLASLSSSTSDPNSANNSASISTGVINRTDLQLTKIDLTDPVDLTEGFLYELVAVNPGPSDAQNVVITDALDSRVDFYGASLGCSHSSGLVTCNVGTLPANSSARYLISVAPNNVLSGTILSNHAGITGTTVELNPANNLAGPITTTVVQKPGLQADLSVTKETSQTTIYAGGTISYTIVATNPGFAIATNVWLQELVPYGTTVMNITANNPGATGEFCSLNGLCYLGTLPIGGVATVTVELLLDEDYRGASLINQAHVSASQTDPDPTNNMASVTTPVVAPGCAARINNLLPIYLTPQAAVDVAQPGDTVKVAGYCAGVHSRGGFLQSVYIDEPLTIRGGYTVTNWLSSDPVAQPATIDAVGGGRVLYLTGTGVHVNVENLNLTGGSYPAGLGGGVFIAGGANATSAAISGSRIYSNTASTGGGLYAAGTVTLTGSEVLSNTAPGNGGGAYLTGATNIVNSRITNNQTGANGGGLYGASSLNLIETEVSNNSSAILGGGAYVIGTITLEEGRIANNRSQSEGGGLYTDANLIMSNAEFTGNRTTVNGAGGGAFVLGSATLTGGRFDSNVAAFDVGGGLYTHGALTITGTRFSGNRGHNGGGGAFVDGNVVVQDGYFENNYSRNRGGGLAVGSGSSLVMTGTHFINNEVERDHGGGVNVYGGPTVIADCRFEDNRCTDNTCNGGGLYVEQQGNSLTLTRSEFISNRAGASGGGLYTGNTLVMTNTLALGNHASDNGGGVYLQAGNGQIVNDILARNTAANDGAGLYLNSPAGAVEIKHTTIANPTPTAGQAIYVNRGLVFVTNTIVTSYTTAIQRANGTVAEDYNLFFGNSADLNGTVTSGGNSLSGLPPDFVDPAGDDYHLKPASAAVDMGLNAGINDDFDLNLRPAPVSPYVDMGAYEYPGQAIDLRITKLAPATLRAGEVMTYTITVDNLGPSKARELVLTDTLPAGVTLGQIIAPTGASCSAGPNPITCTIPLLWANDNISFSVVVTTNSALEPGTRLDNWAGVRSAMIEANPANNLAIATTIIVDQADLVLQKSGPATVIAGTMVTYTIVTTNTGPSVARSVNIVDYLPTGVNLQSINVIRSGSGLDFCGGATCQLGNVAVAEVVTVTVEATVAPDVSPGSTLTNAASAFSLTTDPNPFNNNVTFASLVEAEADLALTKTDLADPVAPTSTFLYELTLTNNGPSEARNVVITDTLDSNMTFATASSGCTPGGGQVVCNVGALARGSTVRYLIGVVAGDVISGTMLTNVATAGSITPDPNNLNNSDTEQTTVQQQFGPSADLSIAKTASPTTTNAGGQVNFTLTITNAGPLAATGIMVLDQLPAELNLTNISVNNPDYPFAFCNLSGVCYLGSLGLNHVATVNLATQIDPDLTGASLTNYASVSANEVDYFPANNSESETITITNTPVIATGNVYLPIIIRSGPTNLPDLVGSFSLSPDKTSYNAGEAVLITAVVTNQGTAAADGFWVDFYINPSSTPGVNTRWSDVCSLSPCYGLAWYVPGLGPGQSVTLTSTPGSYAADHSRWPGYFAGGSSDLYLYVDSWNPTVPTGGVLESNEGNNQAERHGLTVSGLTVTGDEPLLPEEIPPRPAKLDP